MDSLRRKTSQRFARNAWRTTVACAFALLISVSPASASPYTGDIESKAPDNTVYLDGIGIDQHLDAQLPLDATFTDDYGKTITLGDIFNADRKRPAILVMVYYECPVLCNMVLNDMLRTMNGITSLTAGQDFDVVTVSIDPSETPELASKKKRAYMKEYGHRGDPAGWHFLTGTDENIKKVAETVGFKYRYDEKQQEYVHASGIMVVTPSGHLSRYFYGIDYSPKDLRLSLVEASQNKIGGLADQILLYCFHYDPSTGKYGFMVSNMLKVGGGLTVIGLGGFVLLMIRNERRRNQNGRMVLQPVGSFPSATPELSGGDHRIGGGK
jgi:protein SCO1/2